MLFAILVFFTQVCVAQAYKYISMEDGLGSQKVYRILQDSLGYMWFLTQEGPDRYNGKEIKHYELTDKGQKLNMQFSLNWLYMADDGVLWGTGRKGRIFRYEQGRDRFEQVYMPPFPENLSSKYSPAEVPIHIEESSFSRMQVIEFKPEYRRDLPLLRSKHFRL